MTGAADRAETLRKVVGDRVTPVVIAARMDEPCRELALPKGVAIAIHPE